MINGNDIEDLKSAVEKYITDEGDDERIFRWWKIHFLMKNGFVPPMTCDEFVERIEYDRTLLELLDPRLLTVPIGWIRVKKGIQNHA